MKKAPAPTKYIQANFTECDGIDLLSVFLRQEQRLFPNFASNEKRTIYDGDLDYLNEKKEIIKVFRCQVKSVSSTGRKFKIDYKYLVACSNKISLDPLFFFLVNLHEKGKPRYFYLNLTTFKPDKIAECVKAKKSLNVSIKDFTELVSPSVLVADIEANYLYTFSLSELSLEELRILMSGITYLNNSINKVPLIRDSLFPGFYSFVVEYAKDTDEGFAGGWYSKKHDVLSVMPAYIDSSADLIKTYNPEIKRGKMVTRAFTKSAIDENLFKVYLSFYLKEAFCYSENFLPIMPEEVLYELVFAAFNYEYYKLGNAEAKMQCEADSIPLNDALQFQPQESNKYLRYFRSALCECKKRNVTIIKKIWSYWQEDPRLGSGEVFRQDIKLFFELYSKGANIAIKGLFADHIDLHHSYYYSFEQSSHNRSPILTMASKAPFEYLPGDKLVKERNPEITRTTAFENMLSFAPLFHTIVNKCYKTVCERFDCKYEEMNGDGGSIFVP